jgi:hypothetical protein
LEWHIKERKSKGKLLQKVWQGYQDVLLALLVGVLL